MIDVDEAQARLIAAAPHLPSETVPLAEAAGRVVTVDVVSMRTQPPFASSAMDGYAVRTADMPGPVRVVGESAAGRRYPRPLGHGEAVRIFTGAPVPEGADAILIQEDAARDGDALTATDTVKPNDHIRALGLDFAAGDTLVAAGTVLAPRHIALAGAGGHAELTVARRPRVAFLATGDELVPPGSPTGPDQIVASITPALAATVRAAGADPIDLGIAPDDRAEIARRCAAGIAEADILVTLGGASVGDHDLVKPALSDLGIEPDFWKVAVRPGKPLMFSSRPLVLGLPGNPVSGAVCAVLFLVPLVKAMQGVTAPLPEVREGILGRDLPANGPRRDHMRAVRSGSTITPASRQDSSMLAVLAASDVLLVRQPHEGPVPAGSPCRYIAL
ncbi:molybdopterin molybdenumtransferase MoeA [Acuticoccus sediminis]|uniref:Molybdopterin molybdenumtransferase n=1 Tax=Acuticoccus sediminis TaxID=2184697 RepID=A0A8B2P0P8_9HYPH|nr:gephyrin-like molybdotransferase Glp [Acuticoccus sediminis]RAI04560.1 molybdopterin molybdenumtransferase MoeA [Acuticoccus sediminis]